MIDLFNSPVCTLICTTTTNVTDHFFNFVRQKYFIQVPIIDCQGFRPGLEKGFDSRLTTFLFE